VATRSPAILLIERDSSGKISTPWSLPEPRGQSLVR
jgi:hypothetical protein